DNNGSSIAFCTSSTGADFEGGFSTVAPRGQGVTRWPLPPWPAQTKVCDRTFTGLVPNPQASTNPAWQYASVMAPGQSMDLGNGGRLTTTGSSFGGISAPSFDGLASGTTDGNGNVLITGSFFGEGLPGNTQTYVSNDFGKSFTQIHEFDSHPATTDIAIGCVS